MDGLERIENKLDKLDIRVTDLTIEVRKNNGVKGRLSNLEDKVDEHCVSAETEKKVLAKVKAQGGNKYSYTMMGIMALVSICALAISLLGIIK